MNKKIITGLLITILTCAGVILLITNKSDDTAQTTETQIVDTASSDTGDINNVPTSVTGETFTVDIWADNWFALYVNGFKVGQDSVPITTERSFNKETFTFIATRPLTIGIEAKDFKETDSGIEYIGKQNQQMGDGGLIAQIRDASGNIVTVTDSTWSALVVHKAPLDKTCEKSADPDTDCQFEVTDTPDNWYASSYDSSAWTTATEHSESAVSPKDGYNQVSWDASAQLIWGSDLEQDNTILFKKSL